MQKDIIISGFGGQGLLFAGEVLCRAALLQGLETSWFPSYGPEMRGGTACCTVIISDEPIASPITENPHGVIALNLPSFLKYEEIISPGGLMIANRSMIDESARRTDITCAFIPATEIAEKLGGIRVTNIVALGALVAGLKLFDLDPLRRALESHLEGRRKEILEINIRAAEAGFSAI